MHDTRLLLADFDFPQLRRRRLETLQVNLGYRCNQACLHCHVNAGPNRREQMERSTVDDVLALFDASTAKNLDLTGGAPELNRHFRYLVEEGRRRGARLLDRCNLTVLLEPGQEDLAAFLASHKVEIVASLPCYLEENVDRQRGGNVYSRSIQALQRLNALGYGREGSGLILNLVFNPQGPNLPPPQDRLERDYREYLSERHGVVFNALFTLTNMPIQRFGSTLVSRGEFPQYMALLRKAHREENLDHVMCRDLISIDWQGGVYDCDFNQMLGMPLGAGAGEPLSVRDLLRRSLDGAPIEVAGHCYGCTAGQGSSCGGALD
jgi:radical SAM/Cys-rich protein